MTDDIEVQKNNPLHGIKLEVLLTELVDHYGWEDLAEAMNLNCFKSNPSIKSSLKFLRKTDWAREKVEGFYLYKYKRLPRPDDRQYALPPRDRTVPLNQKPGDTPAPVIKRSPKPDVKADDRDRSYNNSYSNDKRPSKPKESKPESGSDDIWGKWKG